MEKILLLKDSQSNVVGSDVTEFYFLLSPSILVEELNQRIFEENIVPIKIGVNYL